ncbi:MAG: ribosome maturation factor RimP [Ilumatobacteraceae bacterium]
MSDAIVERVTRMIAPLIRDLQLDLYDVEFRGGTLRIAVDTPAGSPSGVDIDTLALVTRMISRDFDHDDPMPGHYTLEVTSPGLERSLRTPAHFQREIGKQVAIRLRDTAGTDRRVQGTLVAADDSTITVRTDEQAERVIEHAQIDRAKTVFVWGPAPKPGKQPRSAKQPATGKHGRAGASTSVPSSAEQEAS